MQASRKTFVLAAAVLSVISLQAIAADPDQPAAGGDPRQMQGAEGTVDIAVTTTTFTVQNVDPATRVVTLKDQDGSLHKVKCGPEVRNFDQIKQGDQVRASVMDETAVAITPGGGQPAAGERQMVAVAPKGAKPGMMMVQTDQMTGKILAIDQSKRLVSVEDPSGTTKTIKASPKVDLSQFKKGDDVTVQVAQGMAITVQSPEASAQPSGGMMQPQPSRPQNQPAQPMQPQPQPQPVPQQ